MKISSYNILIPLILIAPAITLLILIILIPSIQALVMSLTNYTAGRTSDFIGMSNYFSILSDPNFVKSLLNSLYFMFGAVSLELLIGLSGALLLNRRFPLQPLWISLILSPYAISPIVSVVIWKYMLDPSYGIINYLITSLGFEPIIWFSTTLTSFIPIILVDVWKNFPFIFVISYGALTSIPLEIIDASKVDGVTGFKFFRLVELPLIIPALLVGLLFRIIFLFRTFEIVWVFTGGGPGRSTEILSINLYKEAFLYFNFGKASAVSWVMLIITFILSTYLVKKTYRNVMY